MKRLLFILFIFLSFHAFATHMRAGEITWKCLGGYTYEFTITMYTRTSSCAADQCSVPINFGDDTTHYDAYRSNGLPCNSVSYNCFTSGPIQDPNCAHCGQEILPTSLDIKKNIYIITHTYPGPNTYIVSVVDPNRNDLIVNVLSNIPLTLQDTLNIYGPFLGACDNSPILTNPPLDVACVGQCFTTNPGAYDPDGDSLSYKLGVCFEDVSTPIPPGPPPPAGQGYFIPLGVSMNPITGDFVWCSPPQLYNISNLGFDEYNFAFDIEEWRKVGGQYFLMGTVRRDFQVRVYKCNSNPPIIANVNDTCIVANTALTFTVTTHDPDGNNIQSFTASGGPFTLTPAATFTTNVGNPYQSTSTGVFNWTPNCAQIRKQPYQVTFKATDDGGSNNIPLSGYQSVNIKVIAPAPTNLSAMTACSRIILKWDTAPCNNHSGNFLLKYEIFRRDSCDTLHHGYCETGVPAYWNYTLIGTTNYSITTYTDNSALQGHNYSYRVVALYYDGSESYCSNPVCIHLKRDVPIITNVDVISTSTNIGKINVKWIKPLIDPILGFDTTAFGVGPPYTFKLYRAQGYVTPTTLVKIFTSQYFGALITSYLDTNLNTQDYPYNYRVDFYHDTVTTNCSANSASSVFISCQPNDHIITLTWQPNVPWTNYEYDIYKFNSITSVWDSIGTTSLQTFTDTGLANLHTHCYKIKSIGAYPDTSLPHPLINWSEELCCAAQDFTPPCPTTVQVDSSCELSQNLFTWKNPNTFCCNDAVYYIIYYSPVQGGDFSVLDTVYNILTPSFLYNDTNSIAGCYAVTTIDSAGNQSAYSNIICVDNCPNYELPNVFTPNGDGSNDYFTPLHPYKYVKDVDINIYDRWGVLVFHTNNPEIMWDGKSEQTKMLCADGVYYYACLVNDIRLKGIVPHVLKGFVTLLSHE